MAQQQGKYPEGFTPYPEGFTPNISTVEQPVEPVEKPKSFLSKAWDVANTPLIPVTEPTMEEWVKAPSWSATRSALSQATTPLAIAGELIGGLGAFKGLSKLKNIGKGAAAIEEVPKNVPKVADDILGEVPIRPQFNPKKTIGMTGNLQDLTLPPGTQPIKVDTGEVIEPLSQNAEPIIRRIRDKPIEQAGPIREAWNLSRGLMSVDLPFITSAGFRQGLPLIGTKNWIRAWGPSVRSYGSKAVFDAHKALLAADPLMKRGIVAVNRADGSQVIRKGQPLFRETPSIAEQAGVHLTDIGALSSREESIRSQLAERIPVWGKVVAASNRSYAAYINDLRMNTFRNFYEAMPDKNDMVALKKIGDAVNVFTGRGALRGKIPDRIPGIGGTEVSLEKYSQALSEVLFAPKLMASRVHMLNPLNYGMTNPQVRKEYWKALARTAGAWYTFGQIGAITGADISMNPTSTDFGKIKSGNLRLDPAGGFQQYLVFAARMAMQESTSSTSNQTKQFGGPGPYDPNVGNVSMNFIGNKLHPSLKYFIDAAFAKERSEFPMFDRLAQMAIPMMADDLIEIAKEEPELLPFLAPLISGGMGSQYYEAGENFNAPKFIPPNMDFTLPLRR